MENHLTWVATAPIAVALILVALIFRAPLIRLLDRTKRIGKDGAVFEQEATRPQGQQPLTCEAILSEATTPSVVERERRISEILRLVKEANREESWKATVRLLAAGRIEMEFSDIGHVIFGSQLGLLVQLTSSNRPQPISVAQQCFARAREQYAALHKERTFEVWLEFLLGRSLVRKSDDNLELTQYGADFLKFLVDRRRTHERSG